MARQVLISQLPHPIVASVCLAALLLLPLWPLATSLNINNAPEVYFPPTDPVVVFEQRLRDQFPQDQVLAALFEGPDLYSAPVVRALHAIDQSLSKHPLVERVLGVTTSDHIAGTEDGFVVEPLVDIKGLDRTSEQQRWARVADDRFAPGMAASKDGSAVALLIRPRRLESSYQRMELELALRAAVRAAGMEDRLTAVAGQVALDVAELRSTVHDTVLFTPLTLAVGLALLWWMFRRLLAVALGLVAIGAVISATVGLLVLWGKPYTLVSSMIPPLMAALTVALLIHLFNALAHASARGLEGPMRVRRALEEVRSPARYTALTTAVGLASLGSSPIQPIMTFGLVSAAGVVVQYLVVIGLLPSLFARWDRRPWPGRQTSMRWLNLAVSGLARIGIRRAGWVVAVTAAALVVGAPQIAKVEAETDIYQFFQDTHPITQSTKRLEEKLSGVTSLEVVFDAEGRDALKDPARLKAIKAFQTWVEKLPQVDRTLSLPDLIEEMHWAFNEEDPAYRVLPEERALISQYLFIYDGRDLYDIVDREFARTRVVLSLNVHGANAISAVAEAIDQYLGKAETPGLRWTVAGLGKLFAHQEDLLIEGQIRSLWVALGLIFVLMLVQWRSLSAALLCMIPNVSPILLVFILMGIFGIWLDMATAMIASVAVGIAVDDTIHVYHGYSRRVAAGSRPVWALARTYRGAGRAVMATTLVLSAQFLLLVSSAFVPTAEFGLLTTTGLVAALLFDLLLLPAMIVLISRPYRSAPRARGARGAKPRRGRAIGIVGLAVLVGAIAYYGSRREAPSALGVYSDDSAMERVIAARNKLKQVKAEVSRLSDQLFDLRKQNEAAIQMAQETARRAVLEQSMGEERAGAARTAAARRQGFRDRMRNGAWGPAMVVIPAGAFEMGSPPSSPRMDERPRHRVVLPEFSIGKYELTVEEYNQFARETGRRLLPAGDGRLPATGVSWHDGVAYARWLSQQTGRRYRLPSEAEWEYAASAGANTLYWWGAMVGHNNANCFSCGSQWDRVRPAPVGSFPANGFGVHDTSGNVAEWTQDCYYPDYRGAPTDGRSREGDDCRLRVVRGGAYDSVADSIRNAKRSRFDPGTKLDNLGFRLVRER